MKTSLKKDNKTKTSPGKEIRHLAKHLRQLQGLEGGVRALIAILTFVPARVRNTILSSISFSTFHTKTS